MATRTSPTKRAHKVSRAKKPLFDSVIFSGIGRIEKRGSKKALVVYTTEADAIKRGMSRRDAKLLFGGTTQKAGCSENWGIFGGSIKCDNAFCAGSCVLQVNKYDGLGWVDITEGSAVVNTAWAYRCKC